MRFSYRALIAVFAVLALGSAGCGDDGDTAVEGGGQPTVVVTTTILGDVVENLADGQVDVVTIMPVGADPHDFRASAEQVAEIGEAEVLIVNGGDFEEGLLDVIESVEEDGVPVFEALSAVDTIEFGASEHDHAHDHDSADPHVWTDPTRMAVAVDAIAEFLVLNVDGVDADALRASADAYAAELEDLDTEVVDTLAPVDEDDRVLVTNHDSFGYFADRYEFEIVGTVVPSGSTTDGTSAQELAELTEVIEQRGVRAIFAETTTSDELAQTLAAEVGDDIAVVELYTGSLGEPGSDGDTYVAMTRTNAQRIADALAG
jgi:zinc/manganese transport system substrate-binding protein